MNKTHWKKLQNPDYMGAYALDPDKDTIGTIDRVRKEDVQSPNGSKEECAVLHFKESDLKPLVLNVTNSKQIERLYGSPYVEDWQGKKIQLYIAQVQAFGETVDAVRIRPKAPKTEKESLTPSHPKWEQAKKSLQENNVTIQKIRKKYNLSEENAELLQEPVHA